MSLDTIPETTPGAETEVNSDALIHDAPRSRLSSENCSCARGASPELRSVKRGPLALLDQVIVSITNFSATILIGRFCAKEELGIYMLGYSILLFALAVQQMLITSPYILILPRLKGQDAERYTGGAYVQQLSLAAILCAGLIAASIVCRTLHPQLTPVFFSLAFSTPLFLLKEMFRRVCFAYLDILSALIADLVVCVVQVALLVVFALRSELTAESANYIIAAACLAAVLFGLLARRGRFAFALAQGRAVMERNWETGRWIFGSQILWAACLYLYPWLIAHFQGNAATGIWAVCFGVSNLGNPLLLGIQNYIEPKVSHAYAEGGTAAMRAAVWRYSAVLTSSMLAFSLLILGVGDRCLSILYGHQFAGQGMTVFILSLAFAAGAAGFTFSCGYFAAGRGVLDVRVSFVYPVALLLLGLPLTRIDGVQGAAISVLAAYGIASTLRAVQFLATFRNLDNLSAVPYLTPNQTI